MPGHGIKTTQFEIVTPTGIELKDFSVSVDMGEWWSTLLTLRKVQKGGWSCDSFSPKVGYGWWKEWLQSPERIQ